MNALKRLTLGVVLVNAAAFTCLAETQGIEVYEQTPPNKAVLVLAKRDLFTQLVNSVNKDRDKIDKALTAALCRPDMIRKGVTLYSMNLKLAAASFKFLNQDSFQIDMPDNYCYFRSTQPTALGKYADPAFEVHFSVRLHVTLQLPTVEDPRIAVKKATVSIPHLQVKGRDVVADLGVIVTNVIEFFTKKLTGKGIIEKTMQKYLPIDVTKKLDSQLKPVNAEIAKLVKQGVKPTARLKGQQLAVTVVVSQQAITNATNAVENEVSNHRSRKRKPATADAPQTPSGNDQ
jgi:hypothetical protein